MALTRRIWLVGEEFCKVSRLVSASLRQCTFDPWVGVDEIQEVVLALAVSGEMNAHAHVRHPSRVMPDCASGKAVNRCHREFFSSEDDLFRLGT
jgi:hypothetical protein